MNGNDLTALLLREEGYYRHDDAGFLNILGVTIRDGQLVMVSARWDIFVKGNLASDPDAEAMSLLVIDEVLMKPLHKMDRDLMDMVKRAWQKMLAQPGCENTIVAVDLGGVEAGGEGYLLGSQIRRTIPSVFALRTVTDADLPAPIYDGAHQAWKMSPEALVGSLAARASARQVLISDDAADEPRHIATDALRQAGSVDARQASPLTRLLGWMSEIVHKPLVTPLIDKTGSGGHFADRSGGRMRIMR